MINSFCTFLGIWRVFWDDKLSFDVVLLDPVNKKGDLLKRAAQVQKDADEYYDSLTQKEKDDWDVYMKNKYGSKD